MSFCLTYCTSCRPSFTVLQSLAFHRRVSECRLTSSQGLQYSVWQMEQSIGMGSAAGRVGFGRLHHAGGLICSFGGQINLLPLSLWWLDRGLGLESMLRVRGQKPEIVRGHEGEWSRCGSFYGIWCPCPILFTDCTALGMHQGNMDENNIANMSIKIWVIKCQ